MSDKGGTMNKSLLKDAVSKYLMGLIFTALLIFLPAGSVQYWNAWLFLGLMFIPMAIAGIILYVKNPDLLQRRLEGKEEDKGQKQLIALSGILFVLAFVLAGINYRLQKYSIPTWVILTASVIFLIAYALLTEVLKENEYLSRTIQVVEGQTVVDTGLYGKVRHPMYTATLLLYLSMPWILGSPVSFLVMLGYIPIIVQRIRKEEEVLLQELDGYKEYTEKVRYRLIPYIW